MPELHSSCYLRCPIGEGLQLEVVIVVVSFIKKESIAEVNE
eukprot:CAMPEP_0113912978 /NCGR_PEP_ID=MMETSP0780_2-20120614/29263_1 /TAXON_ID=652834 /ORGANISM="Palpitomonas bilix" /LENGTH=40 /DNA_ID=CAMNT_0000910069 /DNA_START=478 /DNA_END=597 /DNA_ORIENTATION=+ /assembly_acc=CAM_ASM_000599